MHDIIEQSSIGKKSQQACEDGLVATPHFVAAIDGSTSKSHTNFHPTMTNGQFCMTLVRQYIQSMPADIDCPHFCQNIAAFIHFAYTRLGAHLDWLEKHPTERMAASAAIFSKARHEVWLIGDCQCLVDGKWHDNPKPYEQLIAEMRSAYIRLQLKQGRKSEDFQVHDDGRDFILPVLVDSCQYQNKTFAVIDGFPMPIEQVRVIDVGGASEIVLATDGYPTLLPTLEQSEQALAQQLSADPLCIEHFKATKGLMKGNCSFDDRSYIRFRTS